MLVKRGRKPLKLPVYGRSLRRVFEQSDNQRSEGAAPYGIMLRFHRPRTTMYRTRCTAVPNSRASDGRLCQLLRRRMISTFLSCAARWLERMGRPEEYVIQVGHSGDCLRYVINPPFICAIVKSR